MGDAATASTAWNWIEQPGVWESALAQYDEAIRYSLEAAESIDERGRPFIWTQTVLLYAERQLLFRDWPRIAGKDPADTAAIEEQLLANGAHLRTWADRVLDIDSSARLVDRLQALVGMLSTVRREYWWFHAVPQDEAQISAREMEFGRRLDDALALLAATPPETPQELFAAALIYEHQAWFARYVERDEVAAGVAEERQSEALRRQEESRLAQTGHWRTACETKRLAEQGFAFWTKSEEAGGPDLAGAKRAFTTGLGLDPADPDLLTATSWLAYEQGNLDTAIRIGTETVAAYPEDPIPAWNLTLYHALVPGHGTEAARAFDTFRAAAALLPPQQRMAVFRVAIRDLDDHHARKPEDDARLRELIGRIAEMIDSMPRESQNNAQYAALYARLGHLALLAQAPADAERLLRHSLALHAHQPNARLDLILAISIQGGDPQDDLAGLLAELYYPLWRDVLIDPSIWYERLMSELDLHQQRFPAQAPIIDAVREALRQSGLDGMTYHDPATGYAVTWDASWPEANGLFGYGWSELVLANETNVLAFKSRREDTGNVATCVARANDEIARADGWIAAIPAVDERGLAITGADAESAWGAVDLTGLNGISVRFYHRCWTLVPGEITLLVRQYVNPADYAASLADRDRVLAGIVLLETRTNPLPEMSLATPVAESAPTTPRAA